MTNDKQQMTINRELIELLAKKIALVREAKLQGCTEDTAEVTQLLAQFGVPEFVWKNLTLSCAAASAIAPPAKSMKLRRVTIVGGSGKMGRFFAQELAAVGHRVSILDRDDWQDAPILLGNADLVLISVPIEHTLNAIAKASSYLSPSTILADLTSVKSSVVPAMLEHHVGPVVSLHPMFGPTVGSFLAQNIIVCPGRQPEAYQWFLDFLKSRGGKLVFCTPQEHDRMMTTVQAIRHFVIFSLGVYLAEEGIDIERSLDCTSSLYRLQLDMVGRLFAQDAPLSMDLMLSSLERRQAIGRLAGVYSRMALLAMQRNLAVLEEEFETARRYFQSMRDRTLEESDFAIESLSIFLAANANEIEVQTDTNNNLAA
jgi:prephenate dehydrogenase